MRGIDNPYEFILVSKTTDDDSLSASCDVVALNDGWIFSVR